MPVELANPNWGNDLLSGVFRDAESNARSTAASYPDVYDILIRVDRHFRDINDSIEYVTDLNLLVPQILFGRAYAATLAGFRLSISCQASEAIPLIRSCIEHSWYALHIARDSAPFKKAEIWFERNDSDAAKKRSKAEFTIAKVKKSHEIVDAATAEAVSKIYELTIDYGAHPNQFGVLGSATMAQGKNEVKFDVGILHPRPELIMFALKTGVDAAIACFKIFAHIFPERFKISGLDDRTQRLSIDAVEVFQRRASQFQAK
jgi:hypothetical protein